MTLRDLMSWERPFGIPVRQKGQPVPSFASLQEELNRFLEHMYRGSEVYLTRWDRELADMMPALNVVDGSDSFRVDVELPGMSPESVDVSVTGNTLTIRGERKEEKEEKEENYIRRETSSGSFYRQVTLPDTANSDGAEASFKNGILTIKVPKKAEAVQPPKKLQIKKAA
ncbi:MAG: Hsp20/alpha crystallin family protein [Proteobacteria bacterium]|nr:Hsp20/alpha crystallin family protein [Pseudomonadota bacterium]